jgi:hypothetical protein
MTSPASSGTLTITHYIAESRCTTLLPLAAPGSPAKLGIANTADNAIINIAIFLVIFFMTFLLSLDLLSNLDWLLSGSVYYIAESRCTTLLPLAAPGSPAKLGIANTADNAIINIEIFLVIFFMTLLLF